MTNNFSDYYKLTEKRLMAYNDLSAKLEIDLLQLQELKREGSFNYCFEGLENDITTKTESLKRQISDGMREVSRLDNAIDAISKDYYADIIRLKYIEGKSDEYIAEVLNCDVSTVRRNKKRILMRMAIRLFGCEALVV